MTKGILGRKVGMTQIFAENGELIPVTVVEAKGNVVLQKKTEEVEGYNAIQLGFDDKRPYDKERKDRLVKVANKPEVTQIKLTLLQNVSYAKSEMQMLLVMK